MAKYDWADMEIILRFAAQAAASACPIGPSWLTSPPWLDAASPPLPHPAIKTTRKTRSTENINQRLMFGSFYAFEKPSDYVSYR
jgi:hypothetical protein